MSDVLTKIQPDQIISISLTHAHSTDLQHLPRWIVASTAKYFENFFRSHKMPFYFEGAHRNTNDEFEYIEFRFNGPSSNEVSKNYYRFDFDINILWSMLIGKQGLYRAQTIIGLIIAATKNICVYKYGNDTVHDDGSFVGTLINGKSIVNNFGIIRPDVNLMQGTIETPYTMQLEIS